MNETERIFFYKIRDAIFSNPFGKTRLAIDLSATGLSESTETREVLKKLIDKVERTIRDVTERCQNDKVNLTREELLLLRFAKLFHVFHLFSKDYDEHIQQQIKYGDERCAVSFAGEILKVLNNYGFNAAESKRFMALFFQMRRAFFFIKKIAGSSISVSNLRRALWNNIFTRDIELYDQHLWNRMEDFSTLILGETGTGKGVAAAAIGRSGYIPFDDKKSIFSESFAKTFVSINLSQFPEQLIESELFGHKKGSFTGAVDAHDGIFSRCSPYGAIFLDEIGDVSVHVQIKLLRVLQDRLFSAVGSHIAEKFQGRVIAATNQSLDTARKEGRFREDFYYRLCSDVIEVPPLRKRLAENPGELLEILTITINRILGKHSENLAASVNQTITENQPEGYAWPGNIRELEQCVRRILLNGNYRWQSSDEKNDNGNLLPKKMKEGAFTASEMLSQYCRVLYDEHKTYEAVARITELDRRTVKKYISTEN